MKDAVKTIYVEILKKENFHGTCTKYIEKNYNFHYTIFKYVKFDSGQDGSLFIDVSLGD